MLLLLLNACGKKENKNTQKTPKPQKTVASAPAPVPKTPPSDSFLIRDVDHRSTRIEFLPDRVLFRKIRQPIVALTFFSSWCAPCRGMLPYLGDLQKKNRQDLFLIGVLVNDDLNDTSLRDFMHRYEAPFFISNAPDNDALGEQVARECNLSENYPLPLTVIYKNGKYVMHIVGAAPYEMLQSLIDQLKEKKD